MFTIKIIEAESKTNILLQHEFFQGFSTKQEWTFHSERVVIVKEIKFNLALFSFHIFSSACVVWQPNKIENASRKCLANGTWAEKTDYSNCTMYEPNIPVEPSGDYSDVIYMVGYALSLIALTIALIIFLKFRYVEHNLEILILKSQVKT